MLDKNSEQLSQLTPRAPPRPSMFASSGFSFLDNAGDKAQFLKVEQNLKVFIQWAAFEAHPLFGYLQFFRINET